MKQQYRQRTIELAMMGIIPLLIWLLCAKLWIVSFHEPEAKPVLGQPEAIATVEPEMVFPDDSHELVEHHDAVGSSPAVARSPKWPAVRNAYFREHSHCEFFGCKSTGPFNVHHVKPFHLHPELELDPSNLITACVGSENHHLYCCHNGDFKDINPDARECMANGVIPAKGLALMQKHHDKKASRSASKTTVAP